MRYKLLGRSDLRVSELALGTMTFGPEWGWGSTKEESKKVFDTYSKAGGNFIDTANRYTEGTSEKYVGEFSAKDREHFVLATKYSLFMRREDPNFSGNHRKNMFQAVEASLKRLKTDYIDLYWLHACGTTLPRLKRLCVPWMTWSVPVRYSISESRIPLPGSYRGPTCWQNLGDGLLLPHCNFSTA